MNRAELRCSNLPPSAAQRQACSCRGLADHLQRLAALAAEGAGVVGELGSLVNKRDAQVNALKGQVVVERGLIERLQ